jgi:hypothetical protein
MKAESFSVVRAPPISVFALERAIDAARREERKRRDLRAVRKHFLFLQALI